MSVRTSRVLNGLRVVTHKMPHLETLSLGVWAGVGARHESAELNGISHFLEHMAFKGTRRRSAREIAEEIEARGGDLNAATSLETTGYYARVLKGDAACALDILADILTESVFAEDELVRERDVILQEIAAANDSPDDLVYDLVQAASFPDQALGRTILGTPDTVGAITPEQLRTHLAEHYRQDALVVSAAGAVDHEEICSFVETCFKHSVGDAVGRHGEPLEVAGDVRARYCGGVRTSTRPFEQAHVVVGFEGPAYGTDDFFTAQVFSGLFGGGMSSRLFQEVRERRGLCYSIYSGAWGLKDTGIFNVHAATSSDLLDELVNVVSCELTQVAEQGVCQAEVVKAKSQLKAGLLMGLESSLARAEQMARHMIAHGRVIDKSELIEKVEAVDATGVQAFVQSLLRGAVSVAVVGAGPGSQTAAEKVREKFELLRAA